LPIEDEIDSISRETIPQIERPGPFMYMRGELKSQTTLCRIVTDLLQCPHENP